MNSLIACVFLALCASTYAAQQKYSVKGRLLCGEKAQVGTLVKLVDKDVGLDDTLGRVNSGSDGSFQVEGSAAGGLTGIDPTVKIYHNCGGGINPCARRWRMKLPKSYIVNANQPSKWLDLGTLNLIVKLEHSEDRDCL